LFPSDTLPCKSSAIQNSSDRNTLYIFVFIDYLIMAMIMVTDPRTKHSGGIFDSFPDTGNNIDFNILFYL